MCSKCYVSKEQMAGHAIGQNIKGFTDTAKRDRHLLPEVEPVNLGGWMVVVGIVVVILAVFGKPLFLMMGV